MVGKAKEQAVEVGEAVEVEEVVGASEVVLHQKSHLPLDAAPRGGGPGSDGSPIRFMVAVELPGKHRSSNTAWLEMMNFLSTGSQKCQAFTPSG